jgi:16S rRNA (guanine527-N7)-methyltransferase
VEHECELRKLLIRSTSELNLTLTEAQIEQFMFYLAQLLQWNRTTNLTSITEPSEVISKHFVDSLTAMAAVEFPLGAVVTDVGAGAGFPGLPLKLVRDDLQLVLIEPVQKKCSFLRSLVGSLRLQKVSIFSGTLQQYINQEHLLSDLMVTRALRFDDIEEQVCKLLRPTGKAILYQTEKMRIHSQDSRFKVQSEKTFSLPMNHGTRVIAVLDRTVPT